MASKLRGAVRSKRKSQLFLLALCCGLMVLPPAGIAQVQQPPVSAPGESFVLHEGVTYRTVDGEALLADIYLPKGHGPFPAVIYLHGGGWRNGNRKQLRRQATLMAQKGVAGVAIEYRLAPAHPYPASLDDAKSAVRWMRQHAKEYHIDGDHIGAVGSSAGGYLAAMLGVESTPPASAGRDRGDEDASVEAVVALNGVFDLSAMPPTTMISDFLGESCAATASKCAEASPVQHVRAGLPPFLILHGTADQTAPYSQAVAFVDRLRKTNNRAEMFVAAGAPHTFWAQPEWTKASFASMSEFLLETLR